VEDCFSSGRAIRHNDSWDCQDVEDCFSSVRAIRHNDSWDCQDAQVLLECIADLACIV